MTDKDYIKNLLVIMGLAKNNVLPNNENQYDIQHEIYEDAINNYKIRVNLTDEEIDYPNDINGWERNNNFNQPENFVVLECVHRLLKKGYRATDIELEKEWHLGHDSKSGRCDIIVALHKNKLEIIINLISKYQ